MHINTKIVIEDFRHINQLYVYIQIKSIYNLFLKS